MSAIFQRPLCEMGAAYDFAFRPLLGEPETGSGGPCDDRPHRVELWAAGADPGTDGAGWRGFGLCPEHEGQLRHFDRRVAAGGRPSRFRSTASPTPPTQAKGR